MGSNLERVPDKILFKILKQVVEGFSSFYSFKRRLDEEVDLIKDIVTPFGSQDKMMDVDYILTVLELNSSIVFGSGILEEKLKRPTLGKYRVEYRVSMTEHKVEIYTQKRESYSEFSSKEMAQLDYNNGDLDWWEGTLRHSEVYDSDTHEVTFEDSELINESKKTPKPKV